MAAPEPTEASPSRRERNKARTRAAILEASLRCITEAGVQATTMDQIAAAADVARATLFNYFPSKSEIVDALVVENDEGFFRAVAAWRSAPGLSTGQRLLGLFAGTAQYLRAAPAQKRALIELSWMHWAEPGSFERIRTVRDAFAGLVRDGLARGDVSPAIDPALAADVICNAYMGIVHRWWMEEDGATDDRLDGTARLLAAMLRSDPAMATRKPPPGSD